MTADYQWFEQAIAALEQRLGGWVTIVDNQGIFHTPAGKLIFSHGRQSHRKIPVCECGFSPRCIDFCRHRMNAECLRRKSAFIKNCWKGVTEIVVPLRRRNHHWGMFYLGAWRTADATVPEGLPADFPEHLAGLSEWEESCFEELSPLLEAFAGGLAERLEDLHAIGGPPQDRAARIREYVTRHAASSQAGISALARELRLSTSRASRLVQQYFGIGLTAMIHQERINRAKVLLLSTDDKLAAIAAATGFSDEYHFNKVFHRIAGVAPGLFRRRMGV